MGFLAGFLSRERVEAARFLAHPLKELRKARKAWSLWALLEDHLVEEPSPKDLEAEASVGLIGGFLTEASDGCKPRETAAGTFLTGSGRIFHPKGWEGLAEALAGKPPPDGLKLAALKAYGCYLLVFASRKTFWLFREPMSPEPLHYHFSPKLFVFSQSKRHLWRLGFRRLGKLKPGWGLKAEAGGASTFQLASLHPEPARMRLTEALERISQSLQEAFQLRVEGLRGRAAVLFSGGLDSSLTAFLLEKAGLKPTLYTAGFESSKDLEEAEEAAEILGLPFKARVLRVEEAERLVEKAVYACERPNRLDVEVTIPLYSAAEEARNNGFNLFFLGQGFDELFAGYARYPRIAGGGWKHLAEALLKDVQELPENLERELATALTLTVRFELPAADLRLAVEALKAPPRLKVLRFEDSLRKRILRKAARKMGLPEALALKPKKAMQFSSGADKALRSLARERNLKVEDFLTEIFFKVFGFRPWEA